MAGLKFASRAANVSNLRPWYKSPRGAGPGRPVLPSKATLPSTDLQESSGVCDKSRIRAAGGETGGAEPEENQILSLEVITARLDGR